MTASSRKDQHLAACAASKAAKAARKAQRISTHEDTNKSRRHEAAVRQILARADSAQITPKLAAAFATVSNPEDWRFSVESTVEGSMTDADYDLTIAAIAFFSCSPSHKIGAIRDNGRTQFTADGFFANVHHATSDVTLQHAQRVELLATAGGLPVKPTWTLPLAA